MHRVADSRDGRCRASHLGGAVLAASGAVTGCAVAPVGYVPASEPAPAQQAVSVEVFAYPKAGQSAEQQRKDRYECHLWAVRETGVELSSLTVRDRVGAPPEVVPAHPPVATTATAATGAAIGALTSRVAAIGLKEHRRHDHRRDRRQHRRGQPGARRRPGPGGPAGQHPDRASAVGSGRPLSSCDQRLPDRPADTRCAERPDLP
ncbi:MAG: hypothetical protein R3E48_11385 [Burkholderiaceae bacterium]